MSYIWLRRGTGLARRRRIVLPLMMICGWECGFSRDVAAPEALQIGNVDVRADGGFKKFSVAGMTYGRPFARAVSLSP
ncbi:hypothetical protein [Pararhizobium gei]|uniref:hypothetical protein n=1 Tax=Pararhizobium gei TaxID=1395951 RepID=UPI0023DCB70F|nr:hypothetical protein [Rhizobium gei]